MKIDAWFQANKFTKDEQFVVAQGIEPEVIEESEKAVKLEWHYNDYTFSKWVPKSCCGLAPKSELAQKTQAEVIARAAADCAAFDKKFNKGAAEYEAILAHAKANKVKGVRRGMKMDTLYKKCYEAGCAFDYDTWEADYNKSNEVKAEEERIADLQKKAEAAKAELKAAAEKAQLTAEEQIEAKAEEIANTAASFEAIKEMQMQAMKNLSRGGKNAMIQLRAIVKAGKLFQEREAAKAAAEVVATATETETTTEPAAEVPADQTDKVAATAENAAATFSRKLRAGFEISAEEEAVQKLAAELLKSTIERTPTEGLNLYIYGRRLFDNLNESAGLAWQAYQGSSSPEVVTNYKALRAVRRAVTNQTL